MKYFEVGENFYFVCDSSSYHEDVTIHAGVITGKHHNPNPYSDEKWLYVADLPTYKYVTGYVDPVNMYKHDVDSLNAAKNAMDRYNLANYQQLLNQIEEQYQRLRKEELTIMRKMAKIVV
jgi:hypothetical protein